MGTHEVERRLAEFRAAYAESVEAGEAMAARAGLRGRSDEWLRRLPVPVAAAVRQAAGTGNPHVEEPGTARRGEVVPEGQTGGVRMSVTDFAYRTMGR
jgi:hypothetical protein